MVSGVITQKVGSYSIVAFADLDVGLHFNSESYISSMLRTVFRIISGFLVLYIIFKKR